MRVRIVVMMAGVAGLLSWTGGCFEIVYINGECTETAHCRTAYNFLGGTQCTEGLCTCPNHFQKACCPDGRSDCSWDQVECRLASICDEGELAEASGSTSTSSSSGTPPVVQVAPGEPCTADEECRGPIDPRCGAARCEEGKCRFEIDAGEETKSQYLGNCLLNRCNFDGDVEMLAAPSDVPFDDNPCTWDVCEGTEAMNPPLPDAAPCLGLDFGICVVGKCRNCSEVLEQEKCPGSLLCDWDTCVPVSCKDGVTSGMETTKDCGGPSWPACRRCDVSEGCIDHSDCFSNSCQGGVCQIATHNDGQVNGDKTGADCGYPGAPQYLCKDGEACNSEFACMSGVCWAGACQPPNCTDDRKNGNEEDIDCGGTCPPCPPK